MAELSTQKYSFPNISFKETIIGPRPTRRPWRDEIGVAGVFRRGPEGPVLIENRQDFTYLFGEDTSPGSIFVQEAMSQGATRFQISRAVPMPNEATASIVLANSNPQLPPQTGVEGTITDTQNFTTGLQLDMSYIGNPIITREPASKISTEDVDAISHPSFRGRALVRFYVLDHVNADNLLTQIGNFTTTITSLTNSTGLPQVALIPKTGANVESFIPNIKPGLLLLPSGASASAKEFDTYRVMSHIFSQDNDNYGLVVVSQKTGNSSATLKTAVTSAMIAAAGGSGITSFSVQGANYTPEENDVFTLDQIGDTEFTIESVTAGSSAGEHTITFSPAITNASLNFPIGTIIRLKPVPPAPNDPKVPQNVTVSLRNSSDSAYVIGYRLESIDGGDLSDSTQPNRRYFGRSFTSPNNSAVQFDGYNLIHDTQGGSPVPFIYWTINDTSQTTNTPYLLVDNQLGVNHIFEPQGGGSSSLIGLRPGGEWYVPFARSSVSIGGADGTPSAFPIRTPVSDILSQLEDAVFSDIVMSSLIKDSTLQIDIPPYSLSLISKEAGAGANRLRWTLSRTVFGTASSATDLLFNGSTVTKYAQVQKFAGGTDGPRIAYRDFYSVNGIPLLRIVAVSPGAYGNKLRIDITPDTTGRFALSVTDEDSRQWLASEYSESFLLENKTIDRQTGIYPDTLNSKLIRAYFLPAVETAQVAGASLDESLLRLLPLRLLPPFEIYNQGFGSGPAAISSQGGQILKSVFLQRGTDTPPNAIDVKDIQMRAQLAALKRLESVNVAILGVPGAVYGDSLYQPVFDEAKAQVERSTPLNGLRFAVFDGPSRMGSRQAFSLSSRIDSPRVVLLCGYQTYKGQQGAGFNGVPSSGTYAGFVASRPPHVSPASTYGGAVPQDALSVDTDNSPEFLDVLTRGRAEALHFDSGLRFIKFLNGLTTSSDSNQRYISVRRIMDHIISDLYDNLQWVRSEPNTRALQRRVAAACDAYLLRKMNDDYLVRVAPTICGEENNTVEDMLRGQLNIQIRVTPVYPADFILVDIIRDLTADFSLSTSNAASANF